MSERERRRAFALVAALVAATLLLLARLDSPEPRDRTKPAGRERATVEQPLAGPPAPRRPEPGAAETESEAETGGAQTVDPATRREAEPSARGFLRAFARYQAGRLDARTRRRLGELAEPELAAALLERPPRPPGRPRGRLRIERLDLFGPVDGRLKAAALVAYGPQRSLFELALAQTGHGWRVSELYPGG